MVQAILAADEGFDHRRVAERDERLGKASGERLEASPLASGQDHGPQTRSVAGRLLRAHNAYCPTG